MEEADSKPKEKMGTHLSLKTGRRGLAKLNIERAFPSTERENCHRDGEGTWD